MIDRLISADSHVVPLPTFWAEYLPAPLRDRAPRIDSTPEGDFTEFEGKRSPVMAINSIAGKSRDDQGFAYERFEEQLAGGHDPAARLADLDRDGVEAEAIYGGGPLDTTDRDLWIASNFAYNDWLADFCSYAPTRMLGVAYIPCETPEMAVREIRRMHAKGLRAALVPANPPDGRWWEDRWQPVLQTLVEANMPAALHVGFSFQRKHAFQGGAAFYTDVMMTKMEMAAPIADFVFGGVLARYPELKVISVEAYIGWLPFVAEYMDHAFRVHQYWNDPGLAEVPSYYLKRQVFATFIEDPVGLRERHTFGVDNIMWSSDYPHGESTFPNSRTYVEKAFAGIPEHEVTKMVYDNAKRVYSI